MRKVTSLAMTLMLAMASTAAFADGTQQNGMLYQSMDHNRMFDGVNLTEHQRQQMRDLMQLARHDLPRVDIAEAEAMHNLVTAEKFDEAAVRQLAEKMAQESINRQVEMAKIRNQMFNLLTPEQKAQLNERYQQRIASWQQQVATMQNTSALKLGTKE